MIQDFKINQSRSCKMRHCKPIRWFCTNLQISLINKIPTANTKAKSCDHPRSLKFGHITQRMFQIKLQMESHKTMRCDTIQLFAKTRNFYVHGRWCGGRIVLPHIAKVNSFSAAGGGWLFRAGKTANHHPPPSANAAERFCPGGLIRPFIIICCACFSHFSELRPSAAGCTNCPC